MRATPLLHFFPDRAYVNLRPGGQLLAQGAGDRVGLYAATLVGRESLVYARAYARWQPWTMSADLFHWTERWRTASSDAWSDDSPEPHTRGYQTHGGVELAVVLPWDLSTAVYGRRRGLGSSISLVGEHVP